MCIEFLLNPSAELSTAYSQLLIIYCNWNEMYSTLKISLLSINQMQGILSSSSGEEIGCLDRPVILNIYLMAVWLLATRNSMMNWAHSLKWDRYINLSFVYKILTIFKIKFKLLLFYSKLFFILLFMNGTYIPYSSLQIILFDEFSL